MVCVCVCMCVRGVVWCVCVCVCVCVVSYGVCVCVCRSNLHAPVVHATPSFQETQSHVSVPDHHTSGTVSGLSSFRTHMEKFKERMFQLRYILYKAYSVLLIDCCCFFTVRKVLIQLVSPHQLYPRYGSFEIFSIPVSRSRDFIPISHSSR